MFRSINVIGKPGAGKGVQGKLIHKYHPRIEVLSSGDSIRNLVLDEYTASEQKEILHSRATNSYVNKDLLFKIIGNYAQKMSADFFLTDGFPRTLEQVPLYEERFDSVAMFYLDVPDDVAIERMLLRERGPTSTPKDAVNRLDAYYKNWHPVFEFYKNEYPNQVHVVNADESRYLVYSQIEHKLLEAGVLSEQRVY